MVLQRPPFLAFLVLAAAASVAGAAFSIRRRETQGAVPLAAVMGFAAWWIVAYGLQLASTTLDAKVFWWGAKYVGIAFVPTAFLVFALEYAGYERWLSRRTVALLSVVPTVELVVVWTNSLHHWFVEPASLATQYGHVSLVNPVAPGFWVFVAYHYVVLLLGTGLIVRLSRSTESLYRSQMAAILLGLAMPWLANGLFLLDVRPQGLDLTPFGFIATGLALGWAVHRAELLDLVPVPRELAREELLESISDATFVVDDHLHVVELNPAAEALVADPLDQPIGRPVAEVLPELADVFEDGLADGVDRQEVKLKRRRGTQVVDVRVSPLRRGDHVRGYILIARDVTDRARHRQRLEVMNRVLRHDIRNDINLILAHAEALSAGDDRGTDRIERIKEIAFDVVSLSDRARTFERTLGGEVELERIDLVPLTASLLDAIRREYPDVTVDTELPPGAPVYADPLIESAVKNLVENAIEHNDRDDRWIAVSVDRQEEGAWVVLEVADNGPGMPPDEREVIERGRETQIQHSSGLGLWLINWIITESGGEVAFAEREPRGTRVTIRLRDADAVDLGRYGPGPHVA